MGDWSWDNPLCWLAALPWILCFGFFGALFFLAGALIF